jgi:hypothetical protein
MCFHTPLFRSVLGLNQKLNKTVRVHPHEIFDGTMHCHYGFPVKHGKRMVRYCCPGKREAGEKRNEHFGYLHCVNPCVVGLREIAIAQVNIPQNDTNGV